MIFFDYNRRNIKIIVRLILAFIIASLFVMIMDFGLFKSFYELYYGDSEIAQFFIDNGTNVFENSTRASTFLIIIYRAFYSMLPIAITIFLFFYYHSKKFPEKWLLSICTWFRLCIFDNQLWENLLFFNIS